jgi:hypothetical protein
MSDADNQMGGDDAGKDNASAEADPGGVKKNEGADEQHDDRLVDQESEESFPASDPPANY